MTAHSAYCQIETLISFMDDLKLQAKEGQCGEDKQAALKAIYYTEDYLLKAKAALERIAE